MCSVFHAAKYLFNECCAAVQRVRQAYGMMGWRVGYIAYPEFGAEGLLAPGALGGAQLKVRRHHALCNDTMYLYV